MTTEIRLTGLDRLEKILAEVGNAGPRLLGAALYGEATAVFNRSQEMVPVDTGALKGTGNVSQPEYTGHGVEVAIGYGGPAVDYALEVHENLEAHHEQGKQAKYLEQPTLEATNGMGERLADRVAARLGEQARG